MVQSSLESALETFLTDVTNVFTNNDTIDISDNTNLAVGSGITLTDDTLTVTAAGSEISGQSSSTLTISTSHITNNQWRLVRSAEDPSNDVSAAYRSVVVAHNLNQYFTGAVTWA